MNTRHWSNVLYLWCWCYGLLWWQFDNSLYHTHSYSNCTPSFFYHVQTPGWWICLQLLIWPVWPGGCSRSVGTHLGSAASTSEHEDRWCQAGLRPRAGQGSRDEQPLIYAAAPDRGLGCWELLLRSWPLLVAGSAIGKEEVGWVRQMGVWEKGGLVIPGDRLCPPAPWSASGSVQHVCRESSLLNTFHLSHRVYCLNAKPVIAK